MGRSDRVTIGCSTFCARAGTVLHLWIAWRCYRSLFNATNLTVYAARYILLRGTADGEIHHQTHVRLWTELCPELSRDAKRTVAVSHKRRHYSDLVKLWMFLRMMVGFGPEWDWLQFWNEIVNAVFAWPRLSESKVRRDTLMSTSNLFYEFALQSAIWSQLLCPQKSNKHRFNSYYSCLP